MAEKEKILQALRESKGLTRAELAERTGIKVRTLEAYEYGRKDINGAKIKTLLRLCNALGCRLDDILTDPYTLEALYEYETPGYTAKLTEALKAYHFGQDMQVNFTREQFDEIIRKAESKTEGRHKK